MRFLEVGERCSKKKWRRRRRRSFIFFFFFQCWYVWGWVFYMHSCHFPDIFNFLSIGDSLNFWCICDLWGLFTDTAMVYIKYEIRLLLIAIKVKIFILRTSKVYTITRKKKNKKRRETSISVYNGAGVGVTGRV